MIIHRINEHIFLRWTSIVYVIESSGRKWSKIFVIDRHWPKFTNWRDTLKVKSSLIPVKTPLSGRRFKSTAPRDVISGCHPKMQRPRYQGWHPELLLFKFSEIQDVIPKCALRITSTEANASCSSVSGCHPKMQRPRYQGWHSELLLLKFSAIHDVIPNCVHYSLPSRHYQNFHWRQGDLNRSIDTMCPACFIVITMPVEGEQYRPWLTVRIDFVIDNNMHRNLLAGVCIRHYQYLFVVEDTGICNDTPL